MPEVTIYSPYEKIYNYWADPTVEEIPLKLMNYLADTDPDAFVTVYTVNSIIYKPKVH